MYCLNANLRPDKPLANSIFTQAGAVLHFAAQVPSSSEPLEALRQHRDLSIFLEGVDNFVCGEAGTTLSEHENGE